MWMRSRLAEEDGDTTMAISTLGEVWDTFGAFDIPSGTTVDRPPPGAARRSSTVIEVVPRPSLAGSTRGRRAPACCRSASTPSARGAWSRAIRAGAESRGTGQDDGTQAQLADALLDAAGVLRGSGASSDADDAALEAASLYMAMGADAWATRAAATISGKAGGRQAKRRRGLGSAGSRSRRANGHVLDLLADGLSNVEIASRLTSAPNGRVTRVVAYRKLGLSQRVELTLAVLAHRD